MDTHAHAAAAHDHGHGHEHNDMAHVAPLKVLLTIFGLLVFFTFLTVYLNKAFHFSGAEVWIAMVIGTIKAVLVGLYFMHLRYDKPFNTMVFLAAFVFVAIFISFTLMDTNAYQRDVNWVDKTPHPAPVAAEAAPAPPIAPAVPGADGSKPSGGH